MDDCCNKKEPTCTTETHRCAKCSFAATCQNPNNPYRIPPCYEPYSPSPYYPAPFDRYPYVPKPWEPYYTVWSTIFDTIQL